MLLIRSKFPLFKAQSKLVYLDNAATSQICSQSLKAMEDYYLKFRANTRRGAYLMSEKATSAYENARNIVAKFIGAENDEIIFTSGTTSGLNMLAYSLGPRLSHRDNIVLTRFEHHANLIPWQQMSKHYGFEIRFIELDKDFKLNLESAKRLIDENTKVLSFALVSNVLGTISPAEELIKIAKNVRALTIIDAAQAVAHLPINVRKLDCEFLVFSGHKMYAPNGIGVLYGKRQLLKEHIEPFFFGGEMVSSVNYSSAEWNEPPLRFEAGTQNIPGVIGLGAAIEFLQKIGWKKIQKHEKELTTYALRKLSGTNIFGPATPHHRTGTISFNLPGVHPHDLAEIVNRSKIAIRAGFHCAEPLHHLFELPGSARISIGIYNNKTDIDKLALAITKAKKIFE